MLNSGQGFEKMRQSQTKIENKIINHEKFSNCFPKTLNSERIKKAFLRNKTLMSKTDDLEIGCVTLNK